MPIKPIIYLAELIGRRFDSSGLQFAHIVGVQFYNSEILAWLRPLLNVNEDSNFTVLPESERGAAILGVAAHLGFQNTAFDRFFFDGTASPGKFFERLHALRDIGLR